MFEAIKEMLSFSFINRAIIVGTLVSLCAALLGVSLVLKRYSNIGDGLSHVGYFAMRMQPLITRNTPSHWVHTTCSLNIRIAAIIPKAQLMHESGQAMLKGKCLRIQSQSTVAIPKETPQPRYHQLVSWARKNFQLQLNGPETARPSFRRTWPPQRKRLCISARGINFHISLVNFQE